MDEQVGISFKIDKVKRDKFKKVATYKNISMNSFLKIQIDEYIDKFYSDFVKSKQQTFKGI